jgi:cystathionine beta-lyase/cystathionine gamma-synthase
MNLDPADIALCIADDGARDDQGAAPASTPIVQTSIFAYPTYRDLLGAMSTQHASHVYTRGQNPTVEAVERKLAALERGEACKCFASGMAAISAVMMGLLKSGDHILFVNQVYGPTVELATHLQRFGTAHDTTYDTDVGSVEQALKPNTRLIWLESPGTMLFRTVDLAAVARLARARGMLTCIDNTWATPLLQKPIELGIDLVVHTATKYLGGHSDLVGGALIGSQAHMNKIFYRAFLLNGGILAPFDAWLLLRGLRTLPVRLAQHEADGLRVAEFLRGHGGVRRVFHPAFEEQTDAVRNQLRGYAGVLSFELTDGSFDNVCRVIDTLKHFRIAVSWGGVESIVITPNRRTNIAALEAQGIPPGLIRISVGLEGADVLIDDLRTALG